MRNMASAPSGVRIVLLGNKGVGKTATANEILGIESFKETETKESEIQRRRVEHRDISVIDTPGINNSSITPKQMRTQMQKCILLSSPGPHVFMLVIRLGEITVEDRNAMKWIEETFGDEALKFIVVLFIGKERTTKSKLNTYIQDDRTQELLSSCGGGYYVINSKREVNPAQITKLLEKIEAVIRQNGNGYYTDEMYQIAQIERAEKDCEEKDRAEKKRKEEERRERVQKEKSEREEKERSERKEMEIRERVEKERREREEKERSERKEIEIRERVEKEMRDRDEKEKIERKEKKRIERKEKEKMEKQWREILEKERRKIKEKQRKEREEKQRKEREEKQRKEREEKKRTGSSDELIICGAFAVMPYVLVLIYALLK